MSLSKTICLKFSEILISYDTNSFIVLSILKFSDIFMSQTSAADKINKITCELITNMAPDFKEIQMFVTKRFTPGSVKLYK